MHLLNLALYAKNVLLFFVIFFWNTNPVMRVVMVCFFQFPLATMCLLVFGSADRRVWAPLVQEVYLVFYFFMYSFSQVELEDEFLESVFMSAYFGGLCLSVFGFLFNFVNENKKQWIPKLAWRK